MRTAGKPEAELWILFPQMDGKGAAQGSPWENAYVSSYLRVMDHVGYAPTDFYACAVSPGVASSHALSRECVPDEESIRRFWAGMDKYRPKCVLLAGEPMLNAFAKEQKIDNWRGSLIKRENPGNAYHEQAFYPVHDPYRVSVDGPMSHVFGTDLTKLSKVLAAPAIPRNYTLAPTFAQARDFLIDLASGVHPCYSVDIETTGKEDVKKGLPETFLSCIGFSVAPYHAFVVPFLSGMQPLWTLDQEAELLLLIARALGREDTQKIFQNANFDASFLWDRHRIMTRGRVWDTLIQHHLLYPDLPGRLGFLTTFYTMDPYYKDEGRDARTDAEFWLYNAKDADVTYRVHHTLQGRLKAGGYFPTADAESRLWNESFRMSIRGIKVDTELRDSLARGAEVELKRLTEKLHEDVGFPLNVNSPTQMLKFLYEDLRLPVVKVRRKNKKTGTTTMSPSAGEPALRKLTQWLRGRPALTPEAQAAVEDITHVFKTILSIREINKLKGTYYTCPISADGRIRSTYHRGGGSPDTGRFGSRKYRDGSGSNLQNVPKSARAYLTADGPGWVLVNVDLAQADARVVANCVHLLGDPGLQALFDSGADYHTANACNIFGHVDEHGGRLMDAVSPDERQLAKRGGHAVNYCCRGKTLADGLSDDKRIVSFMEAERFRSLYLSAYPGVELWHKEVEHKLRTSRMIVTKMGRRRRYLGLIDDAMIRSAVACDPQATVADVVNRGWQTYVDQYGSRRAKIINQCHDSLTFCVWWSYVDTFIHRMRACLEQPVPSTLPFTIPCDFEVGFNMGPAIDSKGSIGNPGGLRRYLAPIDEEQVRTLLQEFRTVHPTRDVKAEIAHVLAHGRFNKDAVEAFAKGLDWREQNRMRMQEVGMDAIEEEAYPEVEYA